MKIFATPFLFLFLLPPPGANPTPAKGNAHMSPGVQQLAPSTCVPKADGDALKVWLPFEGNTADATHHCNDGYTTKAAFTTGFKNNANSALRFNGADDVLELAKGQKYDFTKLTIGVWVMPTLIKPKPGASPNPQQNCNVDSLVNKGEGENVAFSLQLRNCGGSSTFLVDYGHSSAAPAGSTHTLSTGAVDWRSELDLNRWTHLAVTYAAGTLKIYVNGKPTVTQTGIAPPIANDEAIRIGRRPGGNGAFGGSIDEVRIYDRALSDAEVAAMPSTH